MEYKFSDDFKLIFTTLFKLNMLKVFLFDKIVRNLNVLILMTRLQLCVMSTKKKATKIQRLPSWILRILWQDQVLLPGEIGFHVDSAVLLYGHWKKFQIFGNTVFVMEILNFITEKTSKVLKFPFYLLIINVYVYLNCTKSNKIELGSKKVRHFLTVLKEKIFRIHRNCL